MSSSNSPERIGRRDFLVRTGVFSAVTASHPLLAENSFQKVALLPDEENPLVASQPVRWAAAELQRSLQSKGVSVILTDAVCQVEEVSFYVAIGGRTPEIRRGFSGIEAPKTPEAFTVAPGKLFGKPALLVSGYDARGLMYGLLEMTGRVLSSAVPTEALLLDGKVEGAPANQVRSMSRAFVSEVEDRNWYYDKQFWRDYLADLAMSRFNRFSLHFGLGYNFPRNVTGDYFHFPYPYWFQVPGYDVRAVPLADAERDRNLEMLKFITDETKAHGLQCQIGIWTHAYQWTDSPHSDHRIEGLNPENHAAYCRDALALLLKTCSAIEGVTMRVHGESGIPEGSYSFWETLFEGLGKAGRKVEIDMHAKGLDARMIDIAVKTGMPVKVSPKFWAEHLGLGYHQAAIREIEMPRDEDANESVFKLSNGARRFLRYGYGDLFQQGRKYDVLFRIWPGTQRILLWGDPAIAAGIGNSSHFCGAAGVDIFEPLFFKGREGSGLPGGRCAYLDETLNPKGGDWAKYRYTYRVWGRLLYNPKADPSESRRQLSDEFGGAAQHVEASLAQASRILPLLTTAHLPSASNNSFWPELYTNMPIVEGSAPQPYGDTPAPKRFGTVSPLDPALFSTVREHAINLLDGKVDARYSPLEVAEWLEKLAANAEASLRTARKVAKSTNSPEFRRMEEDVLIQSGLGRFFAHKLRSGVLYELYCETKDPASLDAAIAEYGKGRDAWQVISSRAAKVYRKDITFGSRPVEHGHWADRLPAIDKDLAAMQALKQSSGEASRAAAAAKALALVKGQQSRPEFRITHEQPASFRRGEVLPVSIRIAIDQHPAGPVSGVLHYRHVNQAERWQTMELERKGNGFAAELPGEYTNSVYPLQYYFTLRRADQKASLYPGFNTDLNNQPYFVVQVSS